MTNSDMGFSHEVIHNTTIMRFEIPLGEKLAFLDYAISNDDMIFLHTETPPQYEGKGIGSQLARAGLEYAKKNFYRVVPLCPFVEAYINRHLEYKPLVRK